MYDPIYISAISSLSALGCETDQVLASYRAGKPLLTLAGNLACAKLEKSAEDKIDAIRSSNHNYRNLDRSVLMAIATSRKAVKSAAWTGSDIGINFGSSRGATALFEKHHAEFLETGRTHTLASPTTTLGNISSWVAHDLQVDGPEISHSITCSTALHALLNGVAWLRSGMASRFLAGGSEAPLTAFTISQMQAMKIYSKETSGYPCRALDLEKKSNTMVLGEGAAVCALEKESKGALAVVERLGYATEILEHSISISSDAVCFQKSMSMALRGISPQEIDAIVMHAPGTVVGDLSEYKAVQKVFGENFPMLTSNKWMIGHTFGASGMLSIEMAILMLQHQEFFAVPFAAPQRMRSEIRKVLINAVGFGGNAVSVVLALP